MRMLQKKGERRKVDRQIISFGGGVNSVAMTIRLVNEGWRGPIVFADTGAEWPDTYCYMEMFETEFLKSRGLEIIRLGPPPGEYYTEPSIQEPLEEHCRNSRHTPSCFLRWCTKQYKITPMAKWMRKHHIETKLLGFDASEAHRIKNRPIEDYPLADRGIDRDGCKEIVLGTGLPLPHKSNCFFCPFMRVAQWRELWERYPELYERASQLERLASERLGGKVCLDCGERWTLDELRESRFEPQPTLLGLDWEGLQEYRPCVCGV